MRSFPSVRRALFWGLACDTLGASALAEPAPCTSPSVQMEPAARELHPDLPERIQAAFADRGAIDACARVQLRVVDDDIEVTVTLADGRVAERRVERADDVVPTLEALLVVPKVAEAEDAPEPFEAEVPTPSVPEIPRSRPPPSPRFGLVSHERRTPERSSPASLEPLGVEVALVAGAGIGDGQKSTNLGVLGLVDISSWLVGVQARAREYRTQAPTGPADGWATFELAALGGHRVRFPSFELDLVAGPAAAIEAGSVSETGPAPPEKNPESEAGVVPRFVAASHLVFAPRSFLHGFIGIEGEVGARGKGATSGAYELPVWMVGFALGAAVGTR